MMRVPILTYHANNINGMDYHNNDHVALAADLKLINQLGLRIIPLQQLVDWHLGLAPDSSVENAAVLTCDDGSGFDFYDIEHPNYGLQISFFSLLKTHQAATGRPACMTTFVIVSPEARVILDEKCLIGQGWWGDDWWQQAQDSGLMHIANHSWDHNHGVLENLNVNDDSFEHIDNQKLCDQQIRQAQNHLHQHFGEDYQCEFFAYPYGNYSHYLRYDYLPKHGAKIGLKAAFTTESKHVSKNSQTWALPRYVCNSDWKNTTALEKILRQK